MICVNNKPIICESTACLFSWVKPAWLNLTSSLQYCTKYKDYNKSQDGFEFITINFKYKTRQTNYKPIFY